MADKDECKRVYSAAFWCLENRPIDPGMFVRELVATAGCDRFYDMSAVRGAFQEVIGKESMKRITDYREDIVDYRKATQAVFRYKRWASSELGKASGSLG